MQENTEVKIVEPPGVKKKGRAERRGFGRGGKCVCVELYCTHMIKERR